MKLNLIVAGPCKSGKTALATWLTQALLDRGVHVSGHPKPIPPEPMEGLEVEIIETTEVESGPKRPRWHETANKFCPLNSTRLECSCHDDNRLDWDQRLFQLFRASDGDVFQSATIGQGGPSDGRYVFWILLVEHGGVLHNLKFCVPDGRDAYGSASYAVAASAVQVWREGL